MGQAEVTTDHAVIRRWAEERGGFPATVKATSDDDEPGIIRIDYPGYSGEERLERITWEEFFDAFEKNNLAFLYQEEVRDGKTSRFSKLIDRDSTEESSSAKAY